MEIKKELIPKDKFAEITIKEIHNIIEYLFEPLKGSIDKEEMPKYLYSFDYESPENETFSDNLEDTINGKTPPLRKLKNVKDGKVLFLPRKNEYDKIEYYDEVLNIQDLLFDLKHKQQEFTKASKRKIRPQIKAEIIELFSLIFEGKKTITSLEKQLKEKLFAKHYVLTYILDNHASGKGFPVGQKATLERIGNEIMGIGKGNTFYKNFTAMSNKDFNSENTLIGIGGNNWRNIVIELSKNPEALEKYLQSKQL